MDTNAIGKTIRTCRKEKKLTLEVLSGLAGIARVHLCQIELGYYYVPQLDTIFKIAHGLNMKPSTLVELIDQAQKTEDD